ncbi:hypothetical protein ACP70R_026903 [Stipagrostis hirtigluma subsp. patula]
MAPSPDAEQAIKTTELALDLNAGSSRRLLPAMDMDSSQVDLEEDPPNCSHENRGGDMRTDGGEPSPILPGGAIDVDLNLPASRQRQARSWRADLLTA